jgi:ribosome-associated protein
MIPVTDTLSIDPRDIEENFVRASGPGGQNVNKVSTAVELRFDVLGSPSLPEGVRVRLARLAGRKLSDEGILIIRADRFRTQERNREDARERLAELVLKATVVPKRRVPTKPSRASKARRRDDKKKRGHVKRLRGSRDLD